MKTDEMRQRLAKVYQSQKWRDRVARMSQSQVFAVYTKFKLEGKVD